MLWAIYVSDKAESRVNYPIGKQNKVWGVHDSKRATIENVKKGDIVAFVHSIKWNELEGKAPKGFSRVSKEDVHLFRGTVKELVIAKVTNSYYESNSQVWPDDKYPHRFDFEILTSYEHVIFDMSTFSLPFVEATRLSACTQGSVRGVPEITSVQDIFALETADRDVSDDMQANDLDSNSGGMEGGKVRKTHYVSERNPELVRRKKRQVLQSKGKLVCEACLFDFEEFYGDRGTEFIECHHKYPIHLKSEASETKLSDLALLCSNCHRMIHRTKPWISVDQLKSLIRKSKQN